MLELEEYMLLLEESMAGEAESVRYKKGNDFCF
jgi:hypothetical protein